MEIVGQHLRGHALTLGAGIERDYFGRSAFNRFYYATFLNVRNELLSVIPGWPGAHASIPDFLRGTVSREIKSGATRARRAGDNDLVGVCGRARSAALNLAELMETSYGVRVTADYNPLIPVEFKVGDFSLSTVPIEDAKAWPHRGLALSKTIAEAWRQISV